MKRSEINQVISSADEFLKAHQFYLPPFAYWTPADWKKKGQEVCEIVDSQLGWDITDFGLGNFQKDGLFLFTIRNGQGGVATVGQGKKYCEKIMVVEVGQVTPYHFHWLKMEDIINRGGGRLLVQLYNATPAEDLDQISDVHVSLDGVAHTIKAGSVVELKPGESITLPHHLYHSFWAEGSRAMVGEVSLVNDDKADNRFRHAGGRFPEIEEDTDPLYLLVGDYERYFQPKTQS
jgi:D-lyxose ketol-isomerase